MKKTTLIAAVLAIILAACEKENTSPTNSFETITQESKKVTPNNKNNTEDYYDFFVDLDLDQPTENLQPVEALTRIEAALNYNVTDSDADPGHFKMVYQPMSLADFTGSIVSGSDILDFYNNALAIIDNEGSNAVITDGDGPKHIAALDLEFDENNLSAGANLILLVNRLKPAPSPYLPAVRAIGWNNGVCNNTSDSGFDAADVVNDLTKRTGDCDGPYNPPYQSIFTSTRTIPSPTDGSDARAYQGKFTKDDCVSWSAIFNTADAINNNLNAIYPTSHPRYIAKAWVADHEITGTPNKFSPNKYSMRSYVIDAYCIIKNLPPVSHRPTKLWP